MEERDEISLNDALNNFIKQPKIKSRFSQAMLTSCWEELMGKTISKYTSKIYVKDEILFITVESGPLKHQLFNEREQIISIINKHFKEELVKTVVIK